MEVKFTNEKISEHIYRVYGLGDACMYFIKGEKKGLLVDTAYGVGDLKGYIDETFNMPYDVVITHGHADHANGINQWDKVYMNHLDIELYKSRSQIDTRRTLLRKRVENINEYPDEMFQKLFEGEFIDLNEKTVFDLGDVRVEPYHAPGHTQGIMVLLVVEDRICLFGDACGVMTFLFRPETSTVEEYRNTLHKLLSMKDRYDRILRQHGTCESPLSLVEENLNVAEEILNGTDDHVPWEFQEFKVLIAKKCDLKTAKREDGKEGNIVYSPDKIR